MHAIIKKSYEVVKSSKILGSINMNHQSNPISEITRPPCYDVIVNPEIPRVNYPQLHTINNK